MNCPSSDRPCSNPGRPVVDLASGGSCCTWCEAWRAECAARHPEARRVLALPDKASRHATLADHEAVHGKLSRDRLAAEVIAMHQRRRAVANQGAA